ncbi:MAG: hypothetical protein K0A95_04215 [Chromatiales bacterium]|nr:hypothetical protein [Gammaproteobacteria bacterium]MBW6476259.1 hypothetical protein [Chromatiales bacterium]
MSLPILDRSGDAIADAILADRKATTGGLQLFALPDHWPQGAQVIAVLPRLVHPQQGHVIGVMHVQDILMGIFPTLDLIRPIQLAHQGLAIALPAKIIANRQRRIIR